MHAVKVDVLSPKGGSDLGVAHLYLIELNWDGYEKLAESSDDRRPLPIALVRLFLWKVRHNLFGNCTTV
jgi:hypothetical protein